MNLCQVADELTRRVISLFDKDVNGERRLFGAYNWFYQKPGNEHLVLFYEYFHGDSGSGLGASHQTGWTALVAELISEYGNKEEHFKIPDIKKIQDIPSENALQPDDIYVNQL